MLGPSVLFLSAPFALMRAYSARSAGAGHSTMYLAAIVISGLSCLAVLGLLGLGVNDLFWD